MKILIADDEILVRQSIRMFLIDLGVDSEDITEAGDGLEMLEALERSAPQLALVDIRMPAMDGLQAIRQAQDLTPDTDFYILSGFDDFKYAQEAIRLGVSDYILKPPKRAELEQIVEKTISGLEQKKTALIETLKLSTTALLTFTDHAIRLPIPCHPVIVTDDVPSEPFSISELMAGDEDRMIVIPHRHAQRTILFLFEMPQNPGYYETYLGFLVKQYCGSHTLIEGKEITDHVLWNIEYDRMAALADARFAFGGHRLYRSGFTKPSLSAALSAICGQCEKGLRAFAASDYAGFSMASDYLIKNLPEAAKSQPSYAKNILEFLRTAYGLDSCTLENLKGQLLMVSATRLLPPSFHDSQYEEIIGYIRDHYGDNLSLAGLAELFGLSPNYFSTLFKKKAGCNFISYLTSVRMAEGRRLLLETNLTIREIGEKIGYFSASFFIRAFKKAEGITPSEYRKMHLHR